MSERGDNELINHSMNQSIDEQQLYYRIPFSFRFFFPLLTGTDFL